MGSVFKIPGVLSKCSTSAPFNFISKQQGLAELPGWPWICEPLTSAFWASGIMGMCQRTQPGFTHWLSHQGFSCLEGIIAYFPFSLSYWLVDCILISFQLVYIISLNVNFYPQIRICRFNKHSMNMKIFNIRVRSYEVIKASRNWRVKSDFRANYCLFEMGSHYIAEDGLKFLDSVNLLLQPWK